MLENTRPGPSNIVTLIARLRRKQLRSLHVQAAAMVPYSRISRAKLGTVLHRMWVDGTEFRGGRETQTAAA